MWTLDTNPVLCVQRTGYTKTEGRPMKAAAKRFTINPVKSFGTSALLQLFHDLIDAEACWSLAWREIFEGCQELGNLGLCRNQQERVIHHPVVIGIRGDARAFVRIGAEVEYQRQAQLRERLGPDSQCTRGTLLGKDELPVVVA
jgi:hypothetical protein